MTDGTVNPELSKTPETSKLFPLTTQSVERSLTRISEDPESAFMNESKAMGLGNPTLSLGLKILIQTLKPDEGTFTEGALWTHKLLREQAEMLGEKVPVMSPEIWRAHMHDQMEATRKSAIKNPNAGKYDHTIQQIEEISAQDPEFGKALKILTKYRAGQEHFYAGAINTYLPIKKASESERLKKQFNL